MLTAFTCCWQEPKGGWLSPKEPHEVMTAQAAMLKHFEAVQDDKPTSHDRLFSLLPLKQGFTVAHIKICTTSLYQLLRRAAAVQSDSDEVQSDSDGDFMESVTIQEFMATDLDWWGEVLDLGKVAALKPGWDFHREVVTDACAVSVTFSRTEPCPPAATPQAAVRSHRHSKQGPDLDGFLAAGPSCRLLPKQPGKHPDKQPAKHPDRLDLDKYEVVSAPLQPLPSSPSLQGL